MNNESVEWDHRLRAALLSLAKTEEQLAAQEAAAVPYWSPTPTSVTSRRATAAALRAEASALTAGVSA